MKKSDLLRAIQHIEGIAFCPFDDLDGARMIIREILTVAISARNGDAPADWEPHIRAVMHEPDSNVVHIR